MILTKSATVVKTSELEGDIYIGKEVRLIDTPYSFNGSIKLGVADFMGDNLVNGTLVADGGVHFAEGTLKGNIKVNGALVMYIAHIYGNVSIEYGNRFTTYAEIQHNNTRPVFENCLFTLSQEYLPDYFYRNYGSSAELTRYWEDVTCCDGFNLMLVHTFCLDTVNHVDNCKCGIFLPLYLAVVPAAVQYFNLVDKRHPAPLPAGHEDSNKTQEELEDELLGENLLDMSYPEDYEDWLEQMEALTGVNPTTYLPQ